MRILMLNNEFPPLGGGTGVVNQQILRQLASNPAMHIDLVTSGLGSVYEQDTMGENIRVFKVPVRNRDIHHSSNIELMRYFTRALHLAHSLSRRQQYDLTFGFSTVPAGVISLMLGYLRGLPYMVSLQGPDIPGRDARYARLYPFLKPMIMRTWRNAAKVIAISEEQRDDARRCMPGLPITVIPNGIDTEEFKPTERRSPDKSYLTVLCVARMIENKGQSDLIQAMAQLKNTGVGNVRLRLVGSGPLENEMRRQAACLGLSDDILFQGVVGRSNMPAVYREADIFALVSRRECMSMAMLEAMASGLPLVVTQVGGTKELIDGNGLVVPWNNPRRIADALSVLIADGEMRRRMGRRSRQIAIGYGWTGIAESYVALARGVLQ